MIRNKKWVGTFLLLTLLVVLIHINCNQDKNSENSFFFEEGTTKMQNDIVKEELYAIYENQDGTYLYEIYDAEGNVIGKDTTYREPEIHLYDERYIEVQWGAGTGVWLDVYYDLETCSVAQPLECARYIGDGIVGVMADGENRELRLLNPFSDSNYDQSIQLDFTVEMANPSDCIIQLDKTADDELQIEYWNANGEKEKVNVKYGADENNALFFPVGVDKAQYNIKSTFLSKNDLIDEVELYISQVGLGSSGSIYALKINGGELPDEILEARLFLGYFYVTEDEIYCIPGWYDKDNVPTEQEFIVEGFIVCQEEAKEIGQRSDGMKEYIVVEGEQCEYYSYNDLTETGFYEQFVWEKGKGLIKYKSGFGAEKDDIQISVKP